jgi:hypothetical protein
MKKHLRFLTLLMLCGTLACSTAHQKTAGTDSTGTSLATNFEIGYSLGNRGLHRLVGTSEGSGRSHVATYLERDVIDESSVRTEKYQHFVAKLLNFAQTTQRTPSQENDCRSPYSISLKIDGKTYTSKGCRDQNGAAFSELVREGEFLLYSKK